MPKYKKEITTKLGKTYELRTLMPEEAKALQNFFQQIALESTHTLHCKEKPFSISKIDTRIKLCSESDSDLYVGLFDKDKIIGHFYFKIVHPEHPWAKHVGEFVLMILKDYCGQGIGSALLSQMEKFATSVGVTRIEALVRTTNQPGIALYKKAGFQIEGARKNGAYINGSFQDEFYIAKLI